MKVQKEKDIAINCICKQDNGFAVGLKGIGLISIFKRKREGIVMESSSSIKDREIESIISLSSSSDDSQITAFIKSKSRFGLLQDHQTSEKKSKALQGSLDIFVFNSSLVNAIKISYREPFEPLYQFGTHSGEIIDLVTIPSKSFVATLSRDKTLKFWSFSGEQKQLFSFDFPKNELAFDIHPLSLQCAIGFKEGLKIYFMIVNDLQEAYENFAKPCSAVAYSSRGHYLAVGYVSYANYSSSVHIIDPYSLKTVFIRGANPNAIKSICWVGRDRYLVSHCPTSVFVWDARQEFKEIFTQHSPNKNSKYTSVAYDPEFDLLVCCCEDSFVRVYTQGRADPFIEFETGDGIVFTTVAICKRLKVIFFGTNTGSVRVYLWPMISFGRMFESTELHVHLGAITAIRITSNTEYLVTTSEDASIYFMKIKEFSRGADVTGVEVMAALTEQKDADIQNKIQNAFNLNDFSLLSHTMQKVSKS